MSGTRAPGWIRRLGTWTALLLISLALMEGAIRLLDSFAAERSLVAQSPPRTERPTAAGAQRYRLHPYRGWSRRAGVPGGEDHITAHTTRPGDDREVISNLFGYYSPFDDYRDIAADAFVIGIFGGSVAGGYGTIGARPLIEELVRLRPELDGRITVLNFGMGQYKQPQQLAALMEVVALGVPLDIVVNIDGFNEIHVGGRDASAGRHPFFPSHNRMKAFAEWAGGSPSEAFVLASARILQKRSRAEWLKGLGRDGALLGHSELARSLLGIWAGVQLRQSIIIEEELQKALQSELQGAELAGLPEDCLGSADACWELIVDIWERSSGMMQGVAMSAGARYVHLLQPNQYLPGSKPLNPEELETAYDERHPIARRVRAAYPLLRQRGPSLRSRGVAFMDLTGAFEGHDETLYVDRCCHFNEEGYRILSRPLAAWIIDPRSRPPAAR